MGCRVDYLGAVVVRGETLVYQYPGPYRQRCCKLYLGLSRSLSTYTINTPSLSTYTYPRSESGTAFAEKSKLEEELRDAEEEIDRLQG